MSGYGRDPSLQSYDPLASMPRAVGAQSPPQQLPTTGTTTIFSPHGAASTEHIRFLQSQGFSMGMVRALYAQKKSFPVRIWILDNSSSMNVKDAHLFCATTYINVVTRWEELRECVACHSNMAAKLTLPTRYALLNQPLNGAPQYFSISQTGNLQQEEHVLSNVMEHSPSGPTPLTTQLRILREYIASITPQLVAQRQTVPIIVATQALRSFDVLPVCVVLRLCTDDEKAFEFYNSLDVKLSNLPLDILDDYYGEALELYLRNPWLTYGPALHRYREMGFRVTVLDILDERALVASEVHSLCQFLFDPTPPFPDPVSHWTAFMHALHTVQSCESVVWNPIRKSATTWIDLAHLNEVYRRMQGVSPPQAYPPFFTTQSSFPATPLPTATQYTTASSNQQMHLHPHAVPVQVTPVVIPPTTDLVTAIDTTWAKQPPVYRTTKPLGELLATISETFTLVARHDHFEPTKLHPFSTMALTTGGSDVLKRAVRKIRFVLHPDRLPKDLTAEQRLLCQTVWDIISDAWELYSSR